MSGKRRIVCIGNCQAGAIARFLRTVPEISRDYEVRYARATERLDAGDRQSDVFIQQVTHGWETQELNLPAGAKLIRFPVVLAGAWWPQVPYWLRNEHTAHDPATFRHFPYSICDENVIRLAGSGVPRDRLIEAYFELDVVKRYSLDRLYELNLAKARQIDAAADFGLADFVHENGRDQQLFRTLNHPNGPLLALVLEGVLGGLNLEDPAHALSLARKLEGGPGIQHIEAPVHPDVAAHFELTWATGRDRRWTFWTEGDYTFEEHLLRLYDYTYNKAFAAALPLIAAKRFIEAEPLLTVAEDEIPRSAGVLKALARVQTQLGKLEAASTTRLRLLALEPNALNALGACSGLRSAGMKAEASRLLHGLDPALDDAPGVLIARYHDARIRRDQQSADTLLEKATGLHPDDTQVLLARAGRAEAEDRIEDAVQLLERAHYVSNWAPAISERIGRLVRLNTPV